MQDGILLLLSNRHGRQCDLCRRAVTEGYEPAQHQYGYKSSGLVTILVPVRVPVNG